jgi:hypothetical protein
MREGKLKPVSRVMEEADDDGLEREALGTWDGMYHLNVFGGVLLADEEPEHAVMRFFGAHRRVKFFRVTTPGAQNIRPADPRVTSPSARQLCRSRLA